MIKSGDILRRVDKQDWAYLVVNAKRNLNKEWEFLLLLLVDEKDDGPTLCTNSWHNEETVKRLFIHTSFNISSVLKNMKKLIQEHIKSDDCKSI